MQKATLKKWQRFSRSRPTEADRIRTLSFPACETLHGKHPAEQTRLLEENSQCAELLSILRTYHDELGIEDDVHAYAAFVLGVCYCAIIRTENRRS